jgi:hypothetical protein
MLATKTGRDPRPFWLEWKRLSLLAKKILKGASTDGERCTIVWLHSRRIPGVSVESRAKEEFEMVLLFVATKV